MKISYNWLKDYVDIEQTPEELGELFNHLGLAVDGIDEIGAGWTNVVVGKVVTCEPVPKSKHLSICTIDVNGDELLNILCGAPNVTANLTVAVAMVGAKLSDGMEITRRKIFGIESEGMLCSERELGLSSEASGILELPSELPLGSAIEEHLGKRDWIFDLEVTFNRPDWLSHIGVAREISTSTGEPIKLPESAVTESDLSCADKIAIEILDFDNCHRYAARIIEGIKIAPSPLWMQDRLRAVGVRPINNVVDVTNYVLMETGHPLHAFDSHLVQDGKIIVRTAEKGEKFTTLDDKEHKLVESDLLISDPEKAIALAGVMGGQNSEIKDDTHDVLLECACFEPTGIRVTSRDRAIRTESSHRFERGVDVENIEFVINRAASLINELAGGNTLKGIADNYPQPNKIDSIKLRTERVNAILATDLTSKQIADYLISLGCEISHGDIMDVSPPSYRGDLEREIDLIEEVARLYGYNNIGTAEVSIVPLTPEPSVGRKKQRINAIKQTLVELGMHECINLSLVPATDSIRIPNSGSSLKILNPLSDDMAELRMSPLPSLLRAAERNHNASQRDIRLFEWANCFSADKLNNFESAKLAGILSGNSKPEFWREKNAEIDYYDVKGLINQFAVKNSLDNFEIIYYHIVEYFEIGCKMVARSENKEIDIGIFGKVDPDVTQQFNVDFPIWYFEFNGEALLEHDATMRTITELPRYPSALRDLAFVVDESVLSGSLELVISKNGGELLKEVEFFDLFRGNPMEKGKKSLAYHLTFRDNNRTLSDTDVDSLIFEVISAAKAEVGAVIRSG
jgi:phenylalanyl-tRNA synthetase beta chain